jgi:hypothetical protein
MFFNNKVWIFWNRSKAITALWKWIGKWIYLPFLIQSSVENTLMVLYCGTTCHIEKTACSIMCQLHFPVAI